MTDRITATLAVIEAAGEVAWSATPDARARLQAAIDALASATSPDLDAKIAEALVCYNSHGCGDEVVEHNDRCFASRRSTIRDLIVACLAVQGDQLGATIKMLIMDGRAQRQVGFEQAQEKAAKIAESAADYEYRFKQKYAGALLEAAAVDIRAMTQENKP